MKLHIVVNDENGDALFCKITLLAYSAGNSAVSKREIAYCGGKHTFALKSGLYDICVQKGKMYEPYKKRVEMADRDIALDITLCKILDTESIGLYSFDAHSHVSRDELLDTGNLLSASTIMKGEGFNFFFAGSPYDHCTHLEYLNSCFANTDSYRDRFSDDIKSVNADDFLLDIGNEIVKCRYGHVFIMNYTQYPPFSKFYDHSFDPWLYTKIGSEPAYNIAYIHEAILQEKTENSVAVAAHPTSWWWHDNGEFITNIAATLGFEILAGSIDAIVIMGYQADHKYYQSLWFDALQNGYFLPGVSETDSSFDTVPGAHIQFKTYTHADAFNIDELCRCIKKGRNIVTSGPVLTMKVNGELPGTVFPYKPNERFVIEAAAFGCCEAMLSKLQIIINGEIYKEVNICQKDFFVTEYASFQEDSFIVIKCFDYAGNVAITNPVYIRNKPFINNNYLSYVTVNVIIGEKLATGSYWTDNGEKFSFKGKICLQMKVSAKLNIQVGDTVKIVRLFELPSLQEIFKNLYFGRFNKDKKFMPGEVPAEAFSLKRIREILDAVNITIEF